MTVYTLFLYIAIAALFLLLTLGYGHAYIKKYARKRPIIWFLQYFVGSLLIFSGAIKAVDPLGTAYKMADYFTLLLPILSFMKPYALYFAFFMIVLEVVLGINMILGHHKRWTAILTLLMMLFFTFLTGYNYLTGYMPEGVGPFAFGQWTAFAETNIRVTDCGCFGDFMKLLPIETFLKDIFLTGLAGYLFVTTAAHKTLISEEKKWGPLRVQFYLSTLFTILVSVFCLMNFYWGLPMIDFRPFAEGTNIALAREECNKNAPDVVRTFTYVNKASGETATLTSKQMTEEFDKYKYLFEKDENGDKKWQIDSTKTRDKVLNKGCDSKVKEMDGSKQETFATHGFSLLVVADKLSSASPKDMKKIGKIAMAANKDGVETHGLYYYFKDKDGDGDYKNDLEKFRHEYQLPFQWKQSDEKLVKTIIRSNPGLLLLHNGTIVKKWHRTAIPAWDVIQVKYMKEYEANLELKVQVEEYIPDATHHQFVCNVQNVKTGELSDKQINLYVLDGNQELLSKMLNDTTSTGATMQPFSLQLHQNENLVPNEKFKDFNFVPNGFMDSKRQAFEIISVK